MMNEIGLIPALMELSESSIENRQEKGNHPTNYIITIVLNAMKGRNRVLYVKRRPVLTWRSGETSLTCHIQDNN